MFITQQIVLTQGHMFRSGLTTAFTGGNKKTKRRREMLRSPPRGSSPLLYPLWTDSSGGPGTARSHLSQSRTENTWAEPHHTAQHSNYHVHCTYPGSRRRTESASVCLQWFRCSILTSRVSINTKIKNVFGLDMQHTLGYMFCALEQEVLLFCNHSEHREKKPAVETLSGGGVHLTPASVYSERTHTKKV